ncbi:hypothetical protein SDC9_53544 [bioreactor metagenome]|uniref:Uncharacterized protein n=1 Tax=bioreactor metagenome TaxID=1076179 RepID=A0A644WUS8_9ZZZZ
MGKLVVSRETFGKKNKWRGLLRAVVRFFVLLCHNDVDDVANHDDLLDALAFEERLDILTGERSRFHGFRVQRSGQRNARAHFAVDLHAVLHNDLNKRALVVDRPGRVLQWRIAEALVDLLADMRSHGREQQNQGVELVFGELALGVEVVGERHHARDGGVELHALVVLANLLDGRVDGALLIRVGIAFALHHLLQRPDPVEEAAAAARALLVPGNRLVERAHKHDVRAEGVRAVNGDVVVGVDNVAAGLAHLFAVAAKHHAVARALHIRFAGRNVSAVVEEFMPEARVQ